MLKCFDLDKVVYAMIVFVVFLQRLSDVNKDMRLSIMSQIVTDCIKRVVFIVLQSLLNLLYYNDLNNSITAIHIIQISGQFFIEQDLLSCAPYLDRFLEGLNSMVAEHTFTVIRKF